MLSTCRDFYQRKFSSVRDQCPVRPVFPMTLRATLAQRSYWPLSLIALICLYGVAKFKRFTPVLSVPLSSPVLLPRDIEVVQDDQSGRKLPRSGFRSHRTGGDSGENKESEEKKMKEVVRATPRLSMVIPNGNLRTVVAITTGQRLWSLSHTQFTTCTYMYSSPRSHEPHVAGCARTLLPPPLRRVTRRRNPVSRVSPGIVENRISMDGDNVCEWSLRVTRLGERGDCCWMDNEQGEHHRTSDRILFM